MKTLLENTIRKNVCNDEQNSYLLQKCSARKQPFPIITQLGSVKMLITLVFNMSYVNEVEKCFRSKIFCCEKGSTSRIN